MDFMNARPIARCGHAVAAFSLALLAACATPPAPADAPPPAAAAPAAGNAPPKASTCDPEPFCYRDCLRGYQPVYCRYKCGC